MLASTENGASPRLSFGIGIWCFSANSIRSRARPEGPVPPGRDDADVRVQRVGRKLEAHLVVALAGRAVGDRIRAGLGGDLHQPLRDQRPGDRRAEQVDALVEGIGAEHRKDEVGDELLAQVLDVDLLDAHHLGLAAGRLEFVALAEIGREGHDLGAELGLEPFEDDRGVETAGIGKHHLLDVFCCGHSGSSVDCGIAAAAGAARLAGTLAGTRRESSRARRRRT